MCCTAMSAFSGERNFSYNTSGQPARTNWGFGSGADDDAGFNYPADTKATRSKGLGRKQACTNCRARKKACDVSNRVRPINISCSSTLLKSKLPVCSLCFKHDEECVYTTTKPVTPSRGGERQSHDEMGDFYLTASTAAELFPGWESSVGHPQLLPWNASISPEVENLDPSWPVSENGITDQQRTGHYSSSGRSSIGEHPEISLSPPNVQKPRSDALLSRADLDQASYMTRPSNRAFFNAPLSQEPKPYSSLLASASTCQTSENEESTRPELVKRLSLTSNTTSTPSIQISEMLGFSAPQAESIFGKNADSSGDLPESLPLSPEKMFDLLQIFFADYHPFLPCIHHRTYLKNVKSDAEAAKSSPLLWAILSVAVSRQGQPNVRFLQYRFLTRAKCLFDRQHSQSDFSVQTLQAAVWIIFQAYASGDLTEAWLFLGKACRLAALLGLVQIDHDPAKRSYSVLRSQNKIDQEEKRKTVWTLFLLDRFISCLGKLPLAIDERLFQVNFPIDDEIFQNADKSVSLFTASGFLQPSLSNFL